MISPAVLFLLGFVIGVLTGFFGVGGGFMVTQALTGNDQWMASFIILAGSITGVHCGVYATEYVTGMRIKVLVGSGCALSLTILLPMTKKFQAQY